MLTKWKNIGSVVTFNKTVSDVSIQRQNPVCVLVQNPSSVLFDNLQKLFFFLSIIQLCCYFDCFCDEESNTFSTASLVFELSSVTEKLQAASHNWQQFAKLLSPHLLYKSVYEKSLSWCLCLVFSILFSVWSVNVLSVQKRPFSLSCETGQVENVFFQEVTFFIMIYKSITQSDLWIFVLFYEKNEDWTQKSCVGISLRSYEDHKGQI